MPIFRFYVSINRSTGPPLGLLAMCFAMHRMLSKHPIFRQASRLSCRAIFTIFQILAKNLKGKALHAPVFYPGSIERTSFAEKNEKKGYLTLELEKDGLKSGRLNRWRFHELPTGGDTAIMKLKQRQVIRFFLCPNRDYNFF